MHTARDRRSSPSNICVLMYMGLSPRISAYRTATHTQSSVGLFCTCVLSKDTYKSDPLIIQTAKFKRLSYRSRRISHGVVARARSLRVSLSICRSLLAFLHRSFGTTPHTAHAVPQVPQSTCHHRSSSISTCLFSYM